MPTYRILPRRDDSRINFLRSILQQGAQAGIQQANADAGLEREKELLQYKQELEQNQPLDLSKSTMEQMIDRYDRLANQDLYSKESQALAAGDVKELKKVRGAIREVTTLRDVLKERHREKVMKETRESLEQQRIKAGIDFEKERLSRLQRTPISAPRPAPDISKADLQSLTSELRSVQSMIARYETAYQEVPDELRTQEEELLFQIGELRKRRGISPKPRSELPPDSVFGPPAPKSNKDLKGKSEDALLKTLIP